MHLQHIDFRTVNSDGQRYQEFMRYMLSYLMRLDQDPGYRETIFMDIQYFLCRPCLCSRSIVSFAGHSFRCEIISSTC